jgi:hypothetical protein
MYPEIISKELHTCPQGPTGKNWEVIRVGGGGPSVIKRSMYSGKIMNVSPNPRKRSTLETNSVIVALLSECGSIARASSAPVVAGTIGVTAGSNQMAVSALKEWS